MSKETEEGDEIVEEEAPKPLEWPGERIDASDALRERGAAYGMYVNTMRALPDIRDGLKPVQRRIIYSMSANNQVFSRGTTKCARIVGDVMGKYHPHGDSSIYDALVRMGQTFSVNVTLITPQGNFGSVDGDPAAAMRYTEAKLSPASSQWKQDTRPEVVQYRPNFDESVNEPVVLPISFPLLLVNGSQGIGWSLACDVPPHNAGEAIDAALLVADNPGADLAMIRKKMPAPDYPSGGVIANPEALDDAYLSGRGSFALRGKYHIDQSSVVITELPYQIGPSQVFQEIVDGAKAEKITEITEKPVNLTSKHGTKLVIKLKRGGNAQALVAQLLKYTSLQTTQKVNFTVLRDGTPSTVGLPEMLGAFVNFRTEVVTKRLEHERDVLLKELRRLTALRSALDVIEKVIKIIRDSKDDQAARVKLQTIVKVTPYGKSKPESIDEEQAEQILSMQLRRLNQLNRFQLDDEIKQKTDRCQEIDRILADPEEITAIVKSELKEARKDFGRDRLTQLSGATPEEGGAVGGAVDQGPAKAVSVWASSAGQAIAFEQQQKTKSAPLALAAGDKTAARVECETSDFLLAFSSSGSAFKLQAGEVGVESKKGRGRQIASFGKDESLAALIAENAQPYLALVTEGGQVKRIAADVLKGAHAGGIQAVNVGDDKLLAVVPHDEKAELIVQSAKGRVLRTSLDALRPVKSGSAGPVKLMKLQPGDRIVSACLAQGESVLVLHQSGFAKRVPLSEIPSKGRGGGGVALTSVDKPSRTPAGEVALTAAGDQLLVVSKAGQLVDCQAEITTRAAVSKPCLDLGQDDQPAFTALAT